MREAREKPCGRKQKEKKNGRASAAKKKGFASRRAKANILTQSLFRASARGPERRECDARAEQSCCGGGICRKNPFRPMRRRGVCPPRKNLNAGRMLSWRVTSNAFPGRTKFYDGSICLGLRPKPRPGEMISPGPPHKERPPHAGTAPCLCNRLRREQKRRHIWASRPICGEIEGLWEKEGESCPLFLPKKCSIRVFLTPSCRAWMP